MKAPPVASRQAAIAAVVLAGGQGSRMGGRPKVLRRLNGERLVDRAVTRITPQVGRVLISSHLPLDELRRAGYSVLPDPVPGHPGPLGGVLAAMEFLLAQAEPPTWLCSVAADTPWFPEDLVAVLARASRGQDMVVAASGGRTHPVFALWALRTAPALRRLLIGEGERSLRRIQSRFRSAVVEWPVTASDPFLNLNTLADLQRARRRIARERR